MDSPMGSDQEEEMNCSPQINENDTDEMEASVADIPLTDAIDFALVEPKELRVGYDIPSERLKGIFPKCARYFNLRITDVGLYSVTRREESFYITNLIVKYFSPYQKRFIITDSSSGMGGNGISFLLHPSIDHVHFVELHPLHCEVLRHNIQVYGMEQKATVHEGNYLEVGSKIQQHVIFHDFPWGGSGYRDAAQLRLGLCTGNSQTWGRDQWVPIEDIVNEYRPRSQLQVCKVPVNFAFRNFFEKIEFQKIKIHKVYNRFSKKLYYYLIFLFS